MGMSPVRDGRNGCVTCPILSPLRGFGFFWTSLPTVETVGYFRSSLRDYNATNPKPMHSFTSCLMHCVWATKERRRLIKFELQSRLWPYVGGIARANKMTAAVVGGVDDHVHVLLSIPST